MNQISKESPKLMSFWTAFSEFPQNVKHIKKMSSFEDSLLFEVSQSQIYRLFFICDDHIWLFADDLKELSENILVSEDCLTVGYYEGENDYLLWGIGAGDDSDHVLAVIFCSFSDDAESQVKTHPLSKFLILYHHLRGHDDKDIGKTWICLIWEFFWIQITRK